VSRHEVIDARIAGGLLLFVVAVALLAPWLPLPDPYATDLTQRLAPPGTGGHWLGTDHLGRDVLARLLLGLRTTLGVAAAGTAVAASVGTSVGLLAGWRGGWLDAVLMRIVDVILAFPYVLLALALVTALGPSLRNAALAVAAVNVPFFARTLRGAVLSLRREDWVEVARLSGHSEWRIVLREIFPNAAPVLIVSVSTTLGWMVLETAGLSFLGLGAQPPRADLGSMLGDGRRYLTLAPHLALVPGLAIVALSLAVHALGDALRDRLDPERIAEAGEDGAARGRAETAEGTPGEREVREPLLEVEDLSVEIPGPGRVVDGVSFRLGRGEALALVGESGSGKTVTVLSLLGLPPAPGARTVSGRALLKGGDGGDDLDLLAVPESTLRGLRGARIGYIPQDPGSSLDPLLPVASLMVEALRAHQDLSRREARRRAAELLDRVHLPDPERQLDAYPHELSGGMRQRVLIAVALAGDPELLVADEPTTALDVTVQQGILELLDEARRERGRALLVVSHDLGVVSALCDHVLVLRQGRVEESGPVERVLHEPRADYTRSLLESVPRIDDPERVLRAGRSAA
jgi:peptide/nickel transport system permease protein